MDTVSSAILLSIKCSQDRVERGGIASGRRALKLPEASECREDAGQRLRQADEVAFGEQECDGQRAECSRFGGERRCAGVGALQACGGAGEQRGDRLG